MQHERKHHHAFICILRGGCRRFQDMKMVTGRPSKRNIPANTHDSLSKTNDHQQQSEAPKAYYSPFVPRCRPILILQRTGPVPILPKGRPVIHENVVVGKKQRKRSDPSPPTSKRTKTNDYEQVAGIAQHPASILLPPATFVFPNDIQDDSVPQTVPFDTLQTIDIVEGHNDDGDHSGNQMFQTLVDSYQLMYGTFGPALQQTLVRNLAVFLRFQGVRYVIQMSDGKFYECGNERLERHIQGLLSRRET